MSLQIKNPLRLRLKEPSLAILEWDQAGSAVNLLSAAAFREWESALSELESLSPKALILISKKPSGFCAGADLKEIQSLLSAGRADLKKTLLQAHRVFLKLESLPAFKIAVIEGACLGGGLELALAFDYRLALDSPRLKIGLPEVRLGLIPGFGGCLRLPRLIGLKAGLSMILRGRARAGREALEEGLIDELIPPAFLAEKPDLVQDLVQDQSQDLDQNPALNRALELARQIIEGKAPQKRPASVPPEGRRPLSRLKLWGRLFMEGPAGRPFLFWAAKKRLLKTGLCQGYLEAPLKALEAVKKTFGSPVTEKSLSREAGAFCDLAPAAQNFIRLFFLREKANKRKIPPQPAFPEGAAAAAASGGPAASKPRSDSAHSEMPRGDSALSAPPRRAGVLGAGLMGGGIAYLLADRGWIVRLKDARPEALSKALKRADSLWRAQIQKGRLTAREAARRAGNLSASLDYSGFSTLDFVIEAAPEDLELKKALIKEASKAMGEKAFLATNTSSLSISGLAEASARPAGFLGLHFFSPAHKTPLVELIPGPQTEEAALSAAFQTARALGKTPALVRDSPGFLVNRLLAPYLTEALWLLEEGNSLELVDQHYQRFGLPMGPFRLMDEAGLDVCAQVISSLQRRGCALDIPEPCARLPEILGAGRKAGRGFYIYEGGRAVNPQALELQKQDSPSDSQDIVERGIYRLINEGMKLLSEGAAESDIDLAMVLGMGFPPFLGGPVHYAKTLGWEKIRARLKAWSETKGPRFAPFEGAWR